MKILAIRIKNLASLEGITEIDFTNEPLCTAGIFAITGPTGAGKSTILDALCLALYGKTPRYLQAKEKGIELRDVKGNTINQGDERGILRDGTADGFAEVDFMAIDGQKYRASWSVRRARNKAEGSLQDERIELKNIDTNTVIPGKKTELQPEIERLVGLNFEQFTRSVLLAQGDFTAFLKASKDEKSSLLEKLTGTQIYSEISKRIYEHWKDEQHELALLNIQREGIATLTMEEVDAVISQKVALASAIKNLETEVDSLKKEIGWHNEWKVLQSSVELAATSLEQAVNNKTNAASREQKLQQVEQVQPTKTWVDALDNSQKQLTGKTDELNRLVDGLEVLQQQLNELNVLVQQAQINFTDKQKAKEDAEPLLNEAKELDVQVSEKSKQLTAATKELDAAKEAFDKSQKTLLDQQKNLTQLEKDIEVLETWKQENSTRQPIAENQSLLVSKLDDGKRLLDTIKNNADAIDANTKQIIKLKEQQTNLTSESVSIQKQLQQSQESYNSKQTALQAVTIEVLEQDKTKQDAAVEGLVKAEAHWTILFAALNDSRIIAEKLSKNKTALQTNEALLTDTSVKTETARTRRETSRRMLDKARVAAAENVEALRAQLVQDEPCPVCGSLEHPYALHNPQLDKVLAELENEHQHNDKNYNELYKEDVGLEKTISQLTKLIREQEEEASVRETRLQQLKLTWESFSVYTVCNKMPNEEIAAWLQQHVQVQKSTQENIKNQIKNYYTEKATLDIEKEKIDVLEKMLSGKLNEGKDLERALQSNQEQLEQFIREEKQSNNSLTELEQLLSSYFSSNDWLSRWKQDPDSFVQRITAFAEEWKRKSETLEANQTRYGILAATIRGTESQLNASRLDFNKKEETHIVLKNQHKELIQKRSIIFNGEAVTQVELKLKNALNVAKEQLDKHKLAANDLGTTITRTTAQKEQAEKDQQALRKQSVDFTIKIDNWLTVYNSNNAISVDRNLLLELLRLEAEWIAAERSSVRAIDDAITTAQTIVKERTGSLEKHTQHRLSETPLKDLQQTLTEKEGSLQSTRQDKNKLDFQLQQDEQNKSKIGDLLKRIDAQALIADNWGKLNEIIGSADGKKFRQVAQEYTLEVLLSYANIQLDALSKRYKLQRIPDSLGLQVLDQDMGDEVRTVFSLSGGESFLVSLALALGLASLSSSRMKVESLFIDEGFGALDPITLNIAMDALERLHNQGRKVGVISHVQEMTERIPVQIKVSKQQSGKSKVEVMGV